MFKLFIVGFPRTFQEKDILSIFEEFGDVTAVRIITDPRTGSSKGYAFVVFDDEAGARLAIKQLNESEIEGRTLHVRFADNDDRGEASASDRPPKGSHPIPAKIKRPRIRK